MPDTQGRREMLGAATAVCSLAVAPRFGHAATTPGEAVPRAGIDAVLRRAVDTKEVPGIAAMAASDKGVFYEAAFGTRDLARGPAMAMAMDTVFRIASMTKLVTSIAAMQLVEQGKLALNDPVPPIDTALSAPQVLDGFDANGAPKLRPAKGPIMLRHLLTRTAGFSYEQWDANTARHVKASGVPSTSTGKVASLRLPLVFDPGARWEYGINLDWVGLLVQPVRRALPVMPGNRRRSLTMADSSPASSKAAPTAAASASITMNILEAWRAWRLAGVTWITSRLEVLLLELRVQRRCE